ncbi:ABC transporter permease [Paenibacillus physcomitrellae]|uniref:Peptide ABC transporter permease n=1 Tax=Paenibacillus physcomitrellae TaxID=1619311 RepID=A0ABQ1FUT0_9BACL|nr:ABC transporter permease subunit [Paenibacillus physcomitrellae]GGA31399.1 peptide ABC transporter permease [Paenibacillus physcomitrellae]
MLRKNYIFWVGCGLLSLLLGIAVLGPVLPFINMTPILSRVTENGHVTIPPYPYSPKNWLGVDKYGVDNLSRVVVGTRETLFIAGSIAILRYVIGIPLGLLARKKRGVPQLVLSVLNRTFSYLPALVAAALFMSLPLIYGRELRTFWIVLFLAFIEVGRVAYLVQQQSSSLSREPYMEAGIALGLNPLRLAKSYYIPGLLPEIIVNFFIDFGKAVLLIGQLGVLGIFIAQRYSTWAGLLNTSNDWGTMLAQHISEISVSRFGFVMIPAAAILFACLTLNLFAEGLRQVFNRRFRVYHSR